MVLIGLGVAFLVLGVVPVVRALRGSQRPSRTSGIQIAVQLPAVDANQAAQHLAEAVRYRTISYDEGTPETKIQESTEAFVGFRDWLATTYPAFSAAAKREVVGDYSLLFTWEGTDASLEPVLLMSHLDVVPVEPWSESEWMHAPFSGDVADGYVWGRGTLDTKGSLIAMLEAAERLVKEGHKPKRTLLFAFGHDEENGGEQGNKKIAELLASRGVRLFFSSDEGGGLAGRAFPGMNKDIALIGVAEKGMLSVELIAKGEGGHASSPLPFDQLAIGKLSAAIEHVGELKFTDSLAPPTQRMLEEMAPAANFTQRLLYSNLGMLKPVLKKVMGRIPATSAWVHTTIAPTVVAGGVKTNMLPPESRSVLNVRVHPVDTVSGVLEKLREAVGSDAELKVLPPSREASPNSNMDGPAFDLLAAVIEQSYPGTVVAPYLVAACTDSVYYQPLSSNVFRFVPIPLGSDDLSRIHGANERLSVEQLGRAVAFYLRLILAVDHVPPTVRNPPGN